MSSQTQTPTEPNSKITADNATSADATNTVHDAQKTESTNIVPSKTKPTDVSEENGTNPFDNDSSADCKSDHHSRMNGSYVPKTHNLMGSYNDVNKTTHINPTDDPSDDSKGANTMHMHHSTEAKAESTNNAASKTQTTVSMAASTDTTEEKEPQASGNDPSADCKSVHHSLMNESSVDVQNTETLHNVMGLYNEVNKMIQSTSQTQLNPSHDLSKDLSDCIEILNTLRPAEHHETVYITNATQLKLCHWRNAAYFYLIRSTIRKCIESNCTVPVVIGNKLMDPTFESVFEDSNRKLKDVLQAYKALDNTSEQNARITLAGACVKTEIEREHVYNPTSKDQLRISTPFKHVLRIAKSEDEVTTINRHRVYLVTENQPAEAYIQLDSLCNEQFQMQSVQEEQHLFYLDLEIVWNDLCDHDLYAPVPFSGSHKQIQVQFSYVRQDKQPRIVASGHLYPNKRAILVVAERDTAIHCAEQRLSERYIDMAIIKHLLEHITDYSSYDFAERALIGLKKSYEIHPGEHQDALRELWMQQFKLLNSESGSLQLYHIFRLQTLHTMYRGDLGIVDVYNIVCHVVHGLRQLADNELREKIGTTIYYSFGTMIRTFFKQTVLCKEPSSIFALYPIFNYFRHFQAVYNSKYGHWDEGRVITAPMQFFETLNYYIPSISDASEVQKLMNNTIQKLETDLAMRSLELVGYQHGVFLEAYIARFCHIEFAQRGRGQLAKYLIHKTMHVIATNCNHTQATSILNYIWDTEAESIFSIISTDYRLWIELFTPPTQQYMQHNDELIQKFKRFVKQSILKFKADDTAELKTLCDALSDPNFPMLDTVDLGLTVLENDYLWSSDSSAISMKENLDIVLRFIPHGTEDNNDISQRLIQFIHKLLQTSVSIRNHILSLYHEGAQTCTPMSDIIKSAIFVSLNQCPRDAARCLLYLSYDEFYKLNTSTFIPKVITGKQPVDAWTNDEIKQLQILYGQHCIDNDDVRVSLIWNCIFDELFANHIVHDTDAHQLQHLPLCLSTAKWIPFARTHKNTLRALDKWSDVIRIQLVMLQTQVESKQVSMSTMDLLCQNQDLLTELNVFVSEIDDSCSAKLHGIVGEMIKQYTKWNCYRKQIESELCKVQFKLDDEFIKILCDWDTASYDVISSRWEWSMWSYQNERYKQLQYKYKVLDSKSKQHYKQLEVQYNALLLQQQQQQNEYKATEFSDGTKGLRNIGNTCFMNSILQSLSHIPRLAQYFMNTPLDIPDPLCQAFGDILSDMWFDRDEEPSLRRFKSEMAKIASIYGEYNPQDPRELLDYLLNALHDKLNTGSTCGYNKEANKIDMNGQDDILASTISWQVFSDQNRSVITDMFYGQTKSTIKCRNCGYVTVIFEPFRVLHVSTAINKRNIKLYDCIDDCFAEKPIYDSLWYCKKCRKKTYGAIDQTNIYKYPSILVIHLKKVEMQNIRKQPKVAYPVNKPLDFSKYCISKKQNIEYDLCAVSTLSGNHCTAYAKNAKNKWFWFNDSCVKQVGNVVVQNAYLLFYQRRC